MLPACLDKDVSHEQNAPSGDGVSVTPTLLVQIRSDLGEVSQVILDYVEAQQGVEGAYSESVLICCRTRL